MIPTDPNARLKRPDAAKALTMAGYPVSPRGCYVLGRSGGLMELDVLSHPGPPQAVSV